jgi:4-carboxymuconolactone decarboxylase
MIERDEAMNKTMAIDAGAKANHAELLGAPGSTLAATDPELVEYFGDFAFDETLADAARLDGALDPRAQSMVQLAAILAAGGLAQFRIVAAAAVANAGVEPVQVKEIVYQSVAYVGMARAYDYLHVVNEVLAEAGFDLPLPGQSASTPETRLDHGKSVQGQVIGDDAVAARFADTGADDAHFQRYLAANCFGDTVGRGGIDLPTRELLTFSMLVALGGADAQVRGHVSGNLAVGNTRGRLLAVLTVLVPYIGYPRTLNGLAALNDITR